MADKTKISWTDASWPVVTGCTHISDGCDHCYAAKLTGGRLRHLPAYKGLAEGGKLSCEPLLGPLDLNFCGGGTPAPAAASRAASLTTSGSMSSRRRADG